MALISRRLLEVRPQEIGKIKLGGRGRQQGTSGGSKMFIPEKYDHFEIVTRARQGGDGAFVRDEAVHAQIGEKPRELEGVLMFPEVEQNLHTTMAHYAGRKPTILCDGEVQKDMGTGKESPCSRIGGGTCPCRPYGRLQLQLRSSPYTGGYYVFRTRSWESINNIQTALEEIHLRFGTLFQAPVKLICYESEDQYTQDGKDRVGRSYKVALVLNVDYDTAAQLMVGAKQRLEATREHLMLTAGEVQKDLDDMDEREAGEIADEFSPPKGLEASVKTQEKLEEVVAGLEPIEASAEVGVVEEMLGPKGRTEEDGICPTTEKPCEHSCEMECYLQDTTPEERNGHREADPVSTPQGGLFDEPQTSLKRGPESWPDPDTMPPQELKKQIGLYRESAREMNLLDATAEEYIEGALKKGSHRATAVKVLRRLYEIVHEGFEAQGDSNAG